jgi:N6-adenosine-specific RNA methylase IME4
VKRYATILADPPVPFTCWSRDTGQGRSAESHYATMSWEDLHALGPLIDALTTDDAVLFLWVCQPLLKETIGMAEAWGFTYKTKAFAWVKMSFSGTKIQKSLGYWTRANTEDVLLFTKGHPKRLRKDVAQIIATLEESPYETPALEWPARRHSQKPEAVQDAIERLVAGPYLELFGRRRRDGWTVVGDEIDGRDIRDSLAHLAEAGEGVEV